MNCSGGASSTTSLSTLRVSGMGDKVCWNEKLENGLESFQGTVSIPNFAYSGVRHLPSLVSRCSA